MVVAVPSHGEGIDEARERNDLGIGSGRLLREGARWDWGKRRRGFIAVGGGDQEMVEFSSIETS